MKTCHVESCGRGVRAKGLCMMHYQRQWATGTVSAHVDRFGSQWNHVSWRHAHVRIKKAWGPARQYQCVECGRRAAQWAYDGTDPSQRYGGTVGGETKGYFSSYPEFYMPMCAKCHSARDQRIASAELREYREWKQRTGLTLADVDKLLGVAA